ncbi:MAG: permease, partial [Phycisphaeraceae bacterium]
TVLVLLLAGPATNIATIGVVKRELGVPAAAAYLGGIAGVSIAIGLAVDAIAAAWSIDTIAQASASGSGVPKVLAWGCLIALVLLAMRPLRRKLLW